jgi:hypothetical protein
VTAAEQEIEKLRTLSNELRLTLEALGPTNALFRDLSLELDMVESKLRFYRQLLS